MTKLLNDWENRTPSFLSKAFDGDSADIISFLTSNNLKRVMEVGFGNNRLLRKLIHQIPDISYFGFDKTYTFVQRAREEFYRPNLRFGLMDIERLNDLTNAANLIKPDVLILRYIVEHLPKWRKVLRTVNELPIPSILLSIYTSPVDKSTSTRLNGGSHTFTVNFISPDDLTNLLNSYSCETKKYKRVNHTLRIFQRFANENSLANSR